MGALDSARAFALSLPGSTEEPHFDMSSFRVRGKIFATVPPGDEDLHVFVDEGEVRAAVAEDPAASPDDACARPAGAIWRSSWLVTPTR